MAPTAGPEAASKSAQPTLEQHAALPSYEAESLQKMTEATARAHDVERPATERAQAAIDAALAAYSIHATSLLALLKPDLEALRAAMTPAQAAQADVLLGVRLSWITDVEGAHSKLAAAVSRVHNLAATDASLQMAELIGRRELAFVLTIRGDVAEAEAEYARLEQLARKPGASELPVWLLVDEADFQARRGQRGLVVPLVRRALDAAQASGDAKDQCDALLAHAKDLDSRGELAEAEAACRDALEKAPTTHSRIAADAERARLASQRQPGRQPIDDLLRCLQESRGLGDELLQVGILEYLHLAYMQLGDRMQSRRYLEQAEELLGDKGTPAVIAAIKSNLIETWDLSDPAVKPLIDEAYSLAQTLEHHGLLAVIASQATSHYTLTKQLAEAEAMARVTLEQARLAGNRYLVAMAYNNIAYVSHENGHPDLACAREALQRARELQYWNLRIAAALTLAQTAVATGDLDEASAALDEAGRTMDAVDGARLGPDLAAMLRSQYAPIACYGEDIVGRRLEALESLDLAAVERARQQDRLLAEGFELASRWKGRSLVEVRRARTGQPGGLASASPAQIQAALPDERTALLEFVESSKELFAYVVTRDAVKHVRLATHDRADELVGAVSSAVGSPDAVPLTEVWTRCHAAWKELLAPVVPKDVESLIVVPARCVANLPIEALLLEPPPPPGQRPRFAIDRYTVSYLPSSTALLELSSPQPAVARGSSARVLLLGDPRLPTSAEGFAPLAGARAECQLIATARADGAQASPCWDDLVNGHADSCDAGPLALRFGAAASADYLLRSLDNFDVIHIAAHGRVDPLDPASTGLVLAEEGGRGGLLTLPDIMSSRVHADPVVLAVCESAGGEYLGGEGRLSMARSFLMAGAGSVVASLWPVDDASAVPVMVEFHRLLAEGSLPVAKALRAAKLASLGQPAPGVVAMRGKLLRTPSADVSRLHPYWWAALVFIGAPR
jgi:CHAT domain-containing protein/tetratricopeptide (TPR) repeat protein